MLPVLVIWLISGCVAQKVGLKSELGFACWNAAFEYDLGHSLELPYNGRCMDPNFLVTVYNCINTYGTCSSKVTAAYQYVHDQCRYWGNATIPVNTMKETLWEHAHEIVLEPAQRYSPVYVSTPLFNQQLTAANITTEQYELGRKFGISLILYWACIVCIAMALNIWKLADRHYLDTLFGKRLTNKFRSLVTIPAVAGKHIAPHKLAFIKLNLPTRGHGLIVLVFLVLNAVFMLVRWDIDSPKPLVFVENSHKVARYLANRCGIMSLYLLPITVLFACRNNPLIVFTGWSHSTFQYYHRWCARVMVFDAILHGVLLTWYSVRENIAVWKWQNVFNWPAGNTAVYSMIVMVFFTSSTLRRRAFETFLALHQFFFLIVLAGVCIHVSDYGWREPCYVGTAFYILEYAFRLYKVIWAGGVQNAEFSLVAGDVFKLKIKNTEFRVCGGQFIYLRVLKLGTFWQTHPFSVMSRSKDSLDLMIKGKRGLTGTILTQVANEPLKCKVLIEGPYGNGRNLSNYRHLVMLAGGVGITALYAYATSHRTQCQQLTFIWTVKSQEHIDAFRYHLLALIEGLENADIRIYVTSLGDEEDLEANDKNSLDHYIQYGRPPIAGILTTILGGASGAAAVCACGPPTFLDSTREAVASSIKDSSEPIDYFEEGFS